MTYLLLKYTAYLNKKIIVYDVCICILYIVMIIIHNMICMLYIYFIVIKNLYAYYSNPQYDIYIILYYIKKK